MYLRKFFAVIFFTFSFFEMAFSKPKEQPPAWIFDAKKAYSEKEYLARVGKGASEELAKSDALSNLSNYIESKIHSETISASTSTMTNGEAKYSAQLIQKINVESSMELFGVEYLTYYYKKEKKNYCLALINKAKYWEKVNPKIENKKHLFEKFYNEAEKKLMTSETILARKYFVFAKKAGDDFCGELAMARLIVGDMADVYSKDEKKVFEVDKKIKDAENATAIFVEIQGDFSKTIESKVKSLFESEKYSFTGNRKNCTHIMSIEIDENKMVSDKGTENEITTVSPSIKLTLTNPFEKQNIFSFSRKAEKGTAYTQDVAVKRGYENLCKTLEAELMDRFNEKMLEER